MKNVRDPKNKLEFPIILQSSCLFTNVLFIFQKCPDVNVFDDLIRSIFIIPFSLILRLFVSLTQISLSNVWIGDQFDHCKVITLK